MYQAI